MFGLHKQVVSDIAKKQQRLDELRNMSSGALGLIMNTINDLENINADINTELSQIDEMLQNLRSAKEDLSTQKTANATIAERFRSFISVDENEEDAQIDKDGGDNMEGD